MKRVARIGTLHIAVIALLVSPSSVQARSQTEGASTQANSETAHVQMPHHHRRRGFGDANTLGTVSPFICGSEPVFVFFTNISGQIFAGTTVNNNGQSCSVAGVTWSGLAGVPLNTLSFDDLGAPCTNDEVFALFSFVNETSPPSTIVFACTELIPIPLSNGFTRYVIHPSNPIPPGVNSVTFAHLGNPNGPTHRTFGNFILNGTISPAINVNFTACPTDQVNCPNP
jgi:hypothetical protein